MKIRLFQRLGLKGRKWYFHARARNGEILMSSEAYRNRQDALDTINLLKREFADAPIVETRK